MTVKQDKEKEAVKGNASEEMKRDTAPTEESTSDTPKAKEEKDTEPRFYVWLANGSVVKCKKSDLPMGSGDAPNGHWQKGKNVFLIVGVYPVEDTVEE